MDKTTIKELKKGDFFTLKPLAYPKEYQVFVKGDFSRSDNGYICTRFSDISSSRLLKPSTVVYDAFFF